MIPVGVGQPAGSLNGETDDGSGSGGNSLLQGGEGDNGSTTLTSGGGNAPVYAGSDSGGTSATGSDASGSSVSAALSDNWPLILGGVAVAGGIATVAYLAHRKHVQR
jgi:hypothetical protein